MYCGICHTGAIIPLYHIFATLFSSKWLWPEQATRAPFQYKGHVIVMIEVLILARRDLYVETVPIMPAINNGRQGPHLLTWINFNPSMDE